MKPWRKIILIILVFYAVGVIAAFTPIKGLVFSTTPVILIITLTAVLWSLNSKKVAVYSLIVGFYGYLWEVVGVFSGFPFGDYSYGNGLGLSLLDVPVVLVVNWALMSVLCYCTFTKVGNRWLRVVLSSLSMVVVDFLIEPVAINFDWWSWAEIEIPITNYLGWFFISLTVMIFYDLLLKDLLVGKKSQLIGGGYLSIQILFFVLVNLSLWVQ